MDKNYFIDTLFDLINESDELEAERLYFVQPKNGFRLSNDWSGFSSLYTANRL